MDYLLFFASAVLLCYILWDVFITVFSTEGAGPFTRFWSQKLWNGLLRIHKRRQIHGLLSLTGPLVLVVTILLWYFLLGLAVFMILVTSPASVVDSTTGEQATLPEKLYFVSTTISSLGYGDWVPASFPWTFLSTLATLAGTVILTISLSYVLAVLGAAIDRRSLAQGVFSMGSNVKEIIEAAQLGDPGNSLKPYVLTLSSQVTHQGLRHLAYPVLKYFHATKAELSPVRAVLLLSDAVFVMDHLPDQQRPPAGVSRTLRSSISSFADLTHTGLTDKPERCEGGLLETARLCGVELGEDDLQQALEAYLPLRTELVALCREDGWGEPEGQA